ncbi:MAG: DUF2325 domain-containing protein, partial [Actinomycetia bacterium]|nr:DUF2325 domain-containing protein [Actinomycetes bacterium]
MEIREYLRCPVVGTCMSMFEQKKILKKARYDITGLDEYEMHVILVNSGRSDNPLARRIQRHLDRKFSCQIKDFGLCSEDTFHRYWREGVRSGDLDWLLWVAATNPNLTDSTACGVFGDWHMHMHNQGRLAGDRLCQIDRLNCRIKELREKLKTARKQAGDYGKERTAAWESLVVLEDRIRTLEKENETLGNTLEMGRSTEEKASLRKRFEKSDRQSRKLAASLDDVKKERNRLHEELKESRETNRLAISEIENLLREINLGEIDCEKCPNRNLCEKKILLVGGITKLEAVYRSLVNGVGGKFKYHDGRPKGGGRSLHDKIGWADVILCPVDVNSHGAALGVKKICRKLDKPYFILRKSSVSSVSRV